MNSAKELPIILFITRKHPPSIGGMERLSYNLITQMRVRVQARAITWGGSQAALPLFFLYALVKSMQLGVRGLDLVHIGDPVLAPIGYIMKRLFDVPVVVTVHGLDITFSPQPYQRIIPRLLRSMDRVVCISKSTYDACIERGMSAEQCLIIHPGVSIPDRVPSRDESRRWLGKMVNRDLADAFVLMTAGRLVPRKGVAWFVESVLPQILRVEGNVCYTIVGSGPDEDRIMSAVKSQKLEGVVHLLGQVPEQDLVHAYAAADLFIMPNVRQQGDMEGFGLVALEAGAHGLPVAAADLEGIRDAIVVGHTGELFPSGDAGQWTEALVGYLSNRARLQELTGSAQMAVRQQFTWARMIDEYEALFRETLAQRDTQDA
jgi:glycosyltransferase involved in cell wall biosynthesis